MAAVVTATALGRGPRRRRPGRTAAVGRGVQGPGPDQPGAGVGRSARAGLGRGVAAIARPSGPAKMAAGPRHLPQPELQSTRDHRRLVQASENVGQGPDIDTVHRALVASRSHYVNMTDTEVTPIGVGVVYVRQHGLHRRELRRPCRRRRPRCHHRAPAPPPTGARRRHRRGPQAAGGRPAGAAPAPTTDRPGHGAGRRPAPGRGASPWMTLALEVTRTWERATG